MSVLNTVLLHSDWGPSEAHGSKEWTKIRHLFASPKHLGFDDSRSKQLDSAIFISEASIDKLHVLVSREEASADGHAGARHHVVLDQTS